MSNHSKKDLNIPKKTKHSKKSKQNTLLLSARRCSERDSPVAPVVTVSRKEIGKGIRRAGPEAVTPLKENKKQDISDNHTTPQTRPRVPSGTVPDVYIKLINVIFLLNQSINYIIN